MRACHLPLTPPLSFFSFTQGAGKGKRVGAPPGATVPDAAPAEEEAGPSGQAVEKV